MTETLNKIREPLKITNKSMSVFASFMMLVLGTALGILAKWLDNLELNSDIWWHRIIEKLDLGNVFSEMAIWLLIALAIAVYSFHPLKAAVNVFLFFAGMCASYHIYTIMFSGFDPSDYMKLWYGLTVASPFIGAVCWYAKSKTAPAIVISTLIVYIMARYCFSMGMVYFSFRSVIYTLIFAGALTVIYRGPRQVVIAFVSGIVLAFIDPLSRFIQI